MLFNPDTVKGFTEDILIQMIWLKVYIQEDEWYMANTILTRDNTLSFIVAEYSLSTTRYHVTNSENLYHRILHYKSRAILGHTMQATFIT